MKKVGLLIDSSFGISKKEAEKNGFNFVSLLITIDGVDYVDGVDIVDQTEFSQKLEKAKNVKTAAPTTADIINEIERGLKVYEHLVVVPLSKGLSSSYSNFVSVVAQSKEYQERVHVIKDAEFCSPYLMTHVDEIVEMLNSAKDWQPIFDAFTRLNSNLWGQATPENLKALVRGGRVSKLAGLVGNMLKIVPIVTYQNGVLESKSVQKVRGYYNAMTKTLINVKEKLATLDDSFDVSFSFEGDQKHKLVLIEKIKEVFDIDEKDIKWGVYGHVIQCHLGTQFMSAVIDRKKLS